MCPKPPAGPGFMPQVCMRWLEKLIHSEKDDAERAKMRKGENGHRGDGPGVVRIVFDCTRLASQTTPAGATGKTRWEWRVQEADSEQHNPQRDEGVAG